MRAFRGVLCLALSPLSLEQRQEMEHIGVRIMLQSLLQHNCCLLTADWIHWKERRITLISHVIKTRDGGKKKILAPCINVEAPEHTLSTKTTSLQIKFYLMRLPPAGHAVLLHHITHPEKYDKEHRTSIRTLNAPQVIELQGIICLKNCNLGVSGVFYFL